MGREPLTPAQRERRRASQKRWEETQEERRAWRDAHREHRIAYIKRWRAKNRDQNEQRLRDHAQKESKPDAAE
jgi:hypothetical protein